MNSGFGSHVSRVRVNLKWVAQGTLEEWENLDLLQCPKTERWAALRSQKNYPKSRIHRFIKEFGLSDPESLKILETKGMKKIANVSLCSQSTVLNAA